MDSRGILVRDAMTLILAAGEFVRISAQVFGNKIGVWSGLTRLQTGDGTETMLRTTPYEYKAVLCG